MLLLNFKIIKLSNKFKLQFRIKIEKVNNVDFESYQIEQLLGELIDGIKDDGY